MADVEPRDDECALCNDYICPFINLGCGLLWYPCYGTFRYCFPERIDRPATSTLPQSSSLSAARVDGVLSSPLLGGGAPRSDDIPSRLDKYKAPIVNEGVLRARAMLSETASAVKDAEETVKDKTARVKAARRELEALESSLDSARAELKTKRTEFKKAHQTHSCFECAVVGHTFTVFLMCLEKKGKQRR